MSETFSIRTAKETDLQDLLDLLIQYELCTDDVLEHLASGYAVAVQGTDIIGVCGIEVHHPNGLLRSLAVAPEWQDRSAGRALVENRIDWAMASGLHSLYLLTIDADRYLARFGFRRLDREEVPRDIRDSYEFSVHCPETAVVMVKSLVDP